MISTETSQFFRGIVDVDLSVVTTTSSGPNNNKLVSSHPMFIELEGQKSGTATQGKEPSDGTQVNNYYDNTLLQIEYF